MEQPKDYRFVYCDWNVFNKIEKLDSLEQSEKQIYEALYKKIVSGEIIVPYSNAHISDLSRGYVKNPEFTPAHLNAITEITNDLCIAQYWNEPNVRWHYRDPQGFLQSVLEEANDNADSFSSLFDSLDEPLLTLTHDLRKSILRMQKMPIEFKQIYQLNPVFNIMYPRTKEEMNLLAFCEDLYSFSQKIKTDYALYKQHKKMLIDLKNKFPGLRKTVNNAHDNIIGQPQYLQWDDIWDELGDNFNVYKNPQADKIVGLFVTTDLKGYRQDERFSNMLDDSLHSFYGAHCDYFLTIDSRCRDKANAVYQKLKIRTKALEPSEFVNHELT